MIWTQIQTRYNRTYIKTNAYANHLPVIKTRKNRKFTKHDLNQKFNPRDNAYAKHAPVIYIFVTKAYGSMIWSQFYIQKNRTHKQTLMRSIKSCQTNAYAKHQFKPEVREFLCALRVCEAFIPISVRCVVVRMRSINLLCTKRLCEASI